MQTHYLGNEEVDAYLTDLARRLLALQGDRPEVWVPLGPSGRELAKRLLTLEPQLETTSVLPAEYDRDNDKIAFEQGAAAAINGKRVMVLDSSVHSGKTMGRVVHEVYSFAAAGVCSYTLVLKQSASFIPSFWAVTIGDYDRAYFLLDCLPNNHFHDQVAAIQIRQRPAPIAKKRSPYFHIRKLNESDLVRPLVVSETKSLDRIPWEDRYYEMKSHPERVTFVLETVEGIIGYLTIERRDGILTIEAVAVSKGHSGFGYGGALLRWGETIARQTNSKSLRLHAIKSELGFYEKFGYVRVSEDELNLGDEIYCLMTKPVLHHLG